MRAVGLLLAWMLLAPSVSLAAERLDPEQIALRYALTSPVSTCSITLCLWAPGTAQESEPPPMRWSPRILELLEQTALATSPPRGEDDVPQLVLAVNFTAETGLWVRLGAVQSKLFVDFGTYDSDSDEGPAKSEHWAGLGQQDPKGRTINLAGGAVLGDLRFSVGSVASKASVAEVLLGEATVGELNPFRDVTAQFDLAFAALPRGLRKRLPPPLLIIRLSAAYLNAFTKSAPNDNGSGLEANSELGIAAGVTW